MGTRKYYNKFRSAVSVNGVTTQKYFDTKEDAEKYYIEQKNEQKKDLNAPWAVRTKKRKGAKNNDLPIGFCDYVSRTVSKAGGIYESHVISCSFKVKDKRHIVRVSYGNKITRNEAIESVKKKVLKKMKEG